MKTKQLLILTLLLISTPLMAQEDFTLEDLNFGGENYRQYLPQNKSLTWWGEELIHKDKEECFLVNKATAKESSLFTLDDLTKALSTVEGAPEVSSLEGVRFPCAKEPLCLVADGPFEALYDFKVKQLVWSRLLEGASHQDFNAQSRRTAYVKDYQLFVADEEGHSRQLTTDGDQYNIIYGQTVHRDEFGITKGTFWSPQGSKLAFYRMDQSMVTDYPQVNVNPSEWGIAEYYPDKYPMTGCTSHVVTVGVYDVTSGKTLYLQTADPVDRYFTNIAWSPDEKTIYIFELNRTQNDCQLIAYSSETGELLSQIYEETDDKYVEPQHPIVFLPWDDSKFVLQSQKDGFNHLYLFDKQGTLVKQLTQGPWVVLDLLGFDEKNKAVIYASNEKSTIGRSTWKVDVRTGRRTLLDNGRGYHYATPSTAGSFIADNYSEPTVPRKIDIIDSGKVKAINFFTAPNPWEGHKQPKFEAGTLLAADDSTLLDYRMVLPYNFDPNLTYPTVVYVYGGPHAHNIEASWHYGSRSWETYMSQKGYILFILDNRGSENRGKAFEQVTFHRLGQEEMKDQVKGVEYLKSLPYVDQERLGVHGWSYGGYMTISLMTNYPDLFKVGVAGGPVIDWHWYEVMYGERYMGTSETNPEGYALTSLLTKAENLKGKLQIIIGYNDNIVVPQHALSFISKCIEAGTQPDFFVYPGEGHNMMGHKSVHLHERITQYFEDYLK